MPLRLKSTLEISGFKVDTAPDGEAASGKQNTGFRPGLLIADSNMPKRDEAGTCSAAGLLVKPIGGGDLVKVIKRMARGA